MENYRVLPNTKVDLGAYQTSYDGEIDKHTGKDQLKEL